MAKPVPDFFTHFIGGCMMSPGMRSAVLVVVAVIAYSTAMAQIGASQPDKGKPDPRVKAILEEADVKYTIDGDGDYRVVNRVDSTRTQLAWILSRTSNYGKIEVRDVISIAYKTSENLSPRLMQRLLEANNRTKIGAWAIQREGDQTIVLFRTQIAANTDALLLLHAILAVTLSADALEQELLGTDDY
ncbi:MAG: hypothetical protein N2663_07865 [Chlorobi bacterium]|nr:hypothetical protein [Chlorobiota bacterium]